MTEMLKLSDKDFKAAIIKMLQETAMNTLETNEKYRACQQRNRSIEKYKIEILDKYMITET